MGIVDEWLAYQFDQAVATLGALIDNLAQEYDFENKRPKYTMQQLLSDEPLPSTRDAFTTRDGKVDPRRLARFMGASLIEKN